MKFIPKTRIKKFQMGGEMAPEEEMQETQEMGGEETPVEGSQDPMMQLAQIFAQGLQNQDCQMLAQGAQIFLQMIQQAGGAPEEAPGEPVFAKNGGRLLRRIRK